MKRFAWRHKLLLFCFFVSGYCGLVYQIVWMRLLGRVFGNSIYATATVLAAFMGGLALGSFFGGRIADRRKDHARLYGILEITIGLYCLALPVLIGLFFPLYAACYQYAEGTASEGISPLLLLVQVVINSALLILPTSCMGATLPILLKHFVKEAERMGATIGLVYAVNTFGAVAGTVGTGFFTIPWFGIWTTIGIGVTLNILVGLLAVFVLETRRRGELEHEGKTEGRGREGAVGGDDTTAAEDASRAQEQLQDSQKPGPAGKKLVFSTSEAVLVLLAFGVSGLVAMVYEVALTRTFSLLIGSSTYAFTLMLAAFIAGIGFGSLLLARWVTAERDLVVGTGLAQAAIGFSMLATVGLIGVLPTWVVWAIGTAGSFAAMQAFEFLFLFLLLLVPTALMGVMFPLVATVWTRRPERLGRSCGEAYFVNTLGAILGSLAGGFIFLRLFGTQRTLELGALVNLLVAAALFLACKRRKLRDRIAAAIIAPAVGIAWLIAGPRWDMDIMTSGPFLYAASKVRVNGVKDPFEAITRILGAQGKIVFHEDGPAASVTVKKKGVVYALSVNGKVDASTIVDVSTQKLLAHLPMLLHKRPEHVLVIGLGSGMTLGSALAHKPQSIDCVEISPAVKVAAEKYFSKYNNNCLRRTEPPIPRIIIGDGRNHVALTSRTYDIISSEPSNPWMAGIGNLFTVEFWELCRRRLRDDGIICQWLQGYQLTPEVFAFVLRTFQHVFPECSVWYSAYSDYLLIGAKKKIRIDPRELAKRMIAAEVAKDLASASIFGTEDFLSHFIAGPGQVRKLTAEPALARANPRLAGLHTDDNCRLEFDMPRYIFKTTAKLPLMLEQHRSPFAAILAPGAQGIPAIPRIEARRTAAWNFHMANVSIIFNDMPEVFRRLGKAEKADPTFPKPYCMEFQLLLQSIGPAVKNQEFAVAKKNIRRALLLYPRIAAMQESHPDLVKEYLKAYIPLRFVVARAANTLAGILLLEAETVKPSRTILQEATRILELARKLDPNLKRVLARLGWVMLLKGDYKSAEKTLLDAISQDPGSVEARVWLGEALEKLGKPGQAAACYKVAIELDRNCLPAYLRLARISAKQGNRQSALEFYRHAIRIDPDNEDAVNERNALRRNNTNKTDKQPGNSQ